MLTKAKSEPILTDDRQPATNLLKLTQREQDLQVPYSVNGPPPGLNEGYDAHSNESNPSECTYKQLRCLSCRECLCCLIGSCASLICGAIGLVLFIVAGSQSVSTDRPLISSFISKVLFAIFSPIICFIIYKEIRRIYCMIDRGDFLLNLWSTSSILLFLCASIFGLLHKIDGICLEIYMVGPIVWVLCQFTVTMFQTRRLQFISKQCKAKSLDTLSYSNIVFIMLYISGIVVLIIASIYFGFFAYGIKHHGSNGCQYIFKPGFFIWATVLLLFVLCWDWTVLILYMRIIYKLKTGGDESQKTREISIDCMLRKIAFLTMIYEIFTICNVIIFAFSNNPIISTFMHQIDNFISVGIVYLMIEDNDNYYRWFVKSICCCLSKTLLLKEFESIAKDEADDENDAKVTEDKKDKINVLSVTDNQTEFTSVAVENRNQFLSNMIESKTSLVSTDTEIQISYNCEHTDDTIIALGSVTNI